MTRKKRILFSAGASAGTFLLVLAVLEASLALAPRIIPEKWAPSLQVEKYRRLDREINDANEAVAKAHPFGFNDRIRTPEKPPGIRFRIAVVGDSFVWGDGVPSGRSWSRKLERKIAEAAPWVEVMSWGQQGWSTADELAFLRERGREYRVNLVLVGWVDNDPDLGHGCTTYLSWQDHLGPLADLFPRTSGLIGDEINQFLYEFVVPERKYDSWRKSLYKPGNLARYRDILGRFSKYCRDEDMGLLFVLTPNYCYSSFANDYGLVMPLMKQEGIPVLDLLPSVCERFESLPATQCWANPVNVHPGEPVTDVYVEEVFRYLRERPEYAWLWRASPGAPERAPLVPLAKNPGPR